MGDARSDESFDFFIIHASAHKPEARELTAALAPHARVFLDEESLPPGALYDVAIPGALEAARVIVVMVGPGDSAAHYQRAEIQRALRRLREGQCVVVPVLLDGVQPGSAAIPYGLEISHAVRLKSGEAAAVADRLLALAAAPTPAASRAPKPTPLWRVVAAVCVTLLIAAAFIYRSRPPPDGPTTISALLAAWDRGDAAAMWEMSSNRARAAQSREVVTAQLVTLRQGYGGPVTARTQVLARHERRHPLTLAPASIEHARFQAVAPVGIVCEDVWLTTEAGDGPRVDVFLPARTVGPSCDGEEELAAAEAVARRFFDALAKSKVEPGDERWFTAPRVEVDRQNGDAAKRLYAAMGQAGLTAQSVLWSGLMYQPYPQIARFGAFAVVILETTAPMGARGGIRVVLERTAGGWRVESFEVVPVQ